MTALFVASMLLSALTMLVVVVALVVWDVVTPREKGRIDLPPMWIGYAVFVAFLLQTISLTTAVVIKAVL